MIPTGGGPDGTEPLMLRKGEAVGYSVHAMHRLKRLYGGNADSFHPERWDPDDVKNPVDLTNIGWSYLPFNGGPRLCLGRKFLFLFFFFKKNIKKKKKTPFYYIMIELINLFFASPLCFFFFFFLRKEILINFFFKKKHIQSSR